MSFIDLAYYASCLGAVGVRGNILVLKWDGVYIDGAYADKACLDGAYIDKVYSCLLLKFP